MNQPLTGMESETQVAGAPHAGAADKGRAKETIKVVFLHRKPRSHGNFSIEFIFNDIRFRLPKNIRSIVKVSKYESSGLFKRLYNAVEAALWQGDVKHITGDVHYLALLLRKRKTVLTIHDCYVLYLKSGPTRLFYKWFWFDLPVWRSRWVIAVSEATKEEVIRFTGCPPDKILVFPDPIHPVYQPSAKPFNKEKPVLLHVGLAPNKNLERLAEALEGIPCHLSVVGKLTEAHIEKLRQHGIEFSAVCNITDEEMFAQYEQCDILAFVSTYEGFGMPIVEANAVGRPVLTSNISSMPYVAGDAACLVDPFDVQSIRNGILKIIHDDGYRAQLVERGFTNRLRFDADAIADMHADLYEKMALRARLG